MLRKLIEEVKQSLDEGIKKGDTVVVVKAPKGDKLHPGEFKNGDELVVRNISKDGNVQFSLPSGERLGDDLTLPVSCLKKK